MTWSSLYAGVPALDAVYCSTFKTDMCRWRRCTSGTDPLGNPSLLNPLGMCSSNNIMHHDMDEEHGRGRVSSKHFGVVLLVLKHSAQHGKSQNKKYVALYIIGKGAFALFPCYNWHGCYGADMWSPML